ncbi:sugar transferase [Singulisphaera sp. Ch08]|uniref:Sugar transferase n=1 Tax=Singulisphaera sp. Ch08 TaxID=3120278 RepID=A0AAU7CLA8_9BACT
MVAAALGLVVAPLLIVVALAIYAQDRGPIFFRQRRVGMGFVEFDLLKLRSMWLNDVPAESVGTVRGDHALVTPIGRIIRRLKIDELPQIWNVLRGDMSLVGPRPMIPGPVERYDAFERRRLAVRPGMTGWAQVNGNTELTWPERIALDVWYVDHWSPGFDLKILVKTLGVIVRGEHSNRDALERANAYANHSRRSG